MIALPLLLALQAVDGPGRPLPAYDALVAQGVAAARAGERDTAEALLQRARALDPSRAEAPVELAGLRFLDGRYPEAASLLEPLLRRGGDAHARDLLATSLHLAGRPDEAVEAWNPLRRPVLRNVRVSGMHDTRARLVVPQLALVEGTVLTRDQLRETRLRLSETGAFARIAVRPVPLGTGEADVDVSLVERRGLGSAPELVAVTLSKALQHTAWVRYDNLDGTGISARASYRWQESQPRAELALSWPRPLGLDASLHALGEWERARYEFDTSGLTLHARGARVALRRVLGARTVGELGWRGRTRSFAEAPESQVPAAARKGRVSGISLRVERRLADNAGHTVDAVASAFGAARPSGSDIEFAVVQIGVRARVAAGDPPPPGRSGSAFAAQVLLGQGTRETPLDEMFVPGAASEMDLPLRAHRSRSGGVLGATPIGRSLILANFEWRPHLRRWGPVDVGGAVFYDTARLGGTVANAGHPFLHDLGVGVRMSALGVTIRLDYARSLSRPRADAWTAGLGQAF